MPKRMLLALLPILLSACAGNPLPKPQPVHLQATKVVCPHWKDASRGLKSKLADEIEAAPPDAVWVKVLVADQSLKDQVTAEGCPAVNAPVVVIPAKK